MMFLASIPGWLRWAACCALLALALFWGGRLWEVKDAAQKAAQDDLDTLERITDGESIDLDDAAARERRLRELAGE